MRRFLPLTLAAGLAACAPQADTYGAYMAEREAQLAGTAPAEGVISGPAVSAAPLDEGFAPAGTPGLRAAAVPTYPAQSYTASSAAAEPQRAAVFSGISDEQNFNAVSSRESIESDKARIERSRAQYMVIAPTALPERRASGGPNIVEYALQTRNPVGVKQYTRLNPLRSSLNERACAGYASADLAQEAFLRAGGPTRDGRSLDPDGDGYACSWDPAPFRVILR